MTDVLDAFAALRLDNDGTQKGHNDGNSKRSDVVSPTGIDDMPFSSSFEGKWSGNDDESKLPTVSTEELKERKTLDDMLEKMSLKLDDMELLKIPPTLSHVNYFPFQTQGITWLVANETSNDIPSFWSKKKIDDDIVRWKCNITKHKTKEKPQPIRGSILADDMGLGKTLQATSLIVCAPPDGQSYPYDMAKDTSAPRCTLVVCPVSVIANWTLQINKFVNTVEDGEILKTDLFYGPNREQALLRAEANEVDVLLTSYHQLVSELQLKEAYDSKVEENEARLREGKRRKYKVEPRTFVFDVAFHRVILDEAHVIRNSRTAFFRSVCQLQTDRKLCLTGTPFVNRPSDLGSLLSFLGVPPLCDSDSFEKYVTEPIKRRKEVGLARLRTTMAHVTLRRSKAQAGIDDRLPERQVQIKKVSLTEGPHKETLELFTETARACIIGLFRLGNKVAGKKLGAIFSLLLRVRQACCHVELVPAQRRAIVRGVAETMKLQGIEDLSTPEGIFLLQKLIGQLEETVIEIEGVSDSDEEPEYEDELESDDDEESCEWESDDEDHQYGVMKCDICKDHLPEVDSHLLPCDHVFCSDCLFPHGDYDDPSDFFCPTCGDEFALKDLDLSNTPKKKTPMKKSRRAALAEEEEVVIEIEEEAGRSPKVQALLDSIEQEMEPDEKGVIFSQWTSFLDIIQDELESVGHTFTRIDGSMNAAARIDAMFKFDTESCDSMKTPRFVLCSLLACGTGINLTRGSCLFMMDPYWNSAAEEQAFDRCHRIGQRRDVRIFRFVMKDSIEERMISLQNAKSALGKGSLEKLSPRELSQARLTFLRDLFNIGEDEVKKWDTAQSEEDILSDDEEDFVVDEDSYKEGDDSSVIDDDDIWV